MSMNDGWGPSLLINKELIQLLQQAGTSKALAVQTSQAIGKLLILDIETHDRKMAAFLTSNGKVS